MRIKVVPRASSSLKDGRLSFFFGMSSQSDYSTFLPELAVFRMLQVRAGSAAACLEPNLQHSSTA
jgi:hypothetical protein